MSWHRLQAVKNCRWLFMIVWQSSVQHERAELERAKEQHSQMIDIDRDQLSHMQLDIDRQKVWTIRVLSTAHRHILRVIDVLSVRQTEPSLNYQPPSRQCHWRIVCQTNWAIIELSATVTPVSWLCCMCDWRWSQNYEKDANANANWNPTEGKEGDARWGSAVPVLLPESVKLCKFQARFALI